LKKFKVAKTYGGVQQPIVGEGHWSWVISWFIFCAERDQPAVNLRKHADEDQRGNLL